MVSREDIIGCYRYILGRSPENDQAIDSHLAKADFAALRREFINSQELRESLGRSHPELDAYLPPQIWSANHVDCHAGTKELGLLLERVRSEWEDFGKMEPHWSVLTHDRYKPEAIASSIDEFFASGQFV